MAAAVSSGIGHRRSCNCAEEKNSAYQNCATNANNQPYYENCIYLTNFASKPNYYQGSEDKNISSLPKHSPVSRQASQNTRGDKFNLTSHSTSISLAQPEVVSSVSGINHTPSSKRSHEKKLKKRSSSAQLRTDRSQKSPRNTMGSGSSVVKEPETINNRSKKKQANDSNSDNGGFETGTPKPALGVKEKLRCSLDKLRMKSPFRWSSSDKISNSGKNSKSKSKNSRRLVIYLVYRCFI